MTSWKAIGSDGGCHLVSPCALCMGTGADHLVIYSIYWCCWGGKEL